MRNRSRHIESRPGTIALARDVILEYPRQAVASFMGVGFVGAIFINALFLQTMPHPAPLFAPKSAPVRVIANPPDPSTFVATPRPVAAPAVTAVPIPVAAPARKDPIAEIIAARPGAAKPSAAKLSAGTPPTATPVSLPAAAAPAVDPVAKRIAAVQRALSEFGYGQIKPTGVFGPETRAAVERLERARGLPVSGQLSERTMREIAIVTGRNFD